MNRRSRGASHPAYWWSLAARSSTSIAFAVKDLTTPLILPYPAVRTPFTFLLDAAKPVWVLDHPVTSRGQLQTGEGYHRRHWCGNSYTYTPAVALTYTGGSTGIEPNWILILSVCESLPALPETAGETRLSGPWPRYLHCVLRHQAPGRDSMHRGLPAPGSRTAAPGGRREEAD